MLWFMYCTAMILPCSPPKAGARWPTLDEMQHVVICEACSRTGRWALREAHALVSDLATTAAAMKISKT